MVWPRLEVIWLRKDDPTGQSKRKEKKRQTEEAVGRQYYRVDRNGLGQLETGQGGKGLWRWMDGWMDDLQFNVLFNSISVISGGWEDDNERLCAMEPRLQLKRFRFERSSNSRPLDQ